MTSSFAALLGPGLRRCKGQPGEVRLAGAARRRRARCCGDSVPSGSASRSNRALKAWRAAAVVVAGSAALACFVWDARRARSERCSGVNGTGNQTPRGSGFLVSLFGPMLGVRRGFLVSLVVGLAQRSEGHRSQGDSLDSVPERELAVGGAGAFVGSRGGVPASPLPGAPPGQAHEVALVPALGEPLVGEGVSELMGVDGHANGLAAPDEHLVHARLRSSGPCPSHRATIRPRPRARCRARIRR